MNHAEVLRRLSRCVEILAASGDPDAGWLAAAIATWRATPDLGLEQAIGLASDWRERERSRAVIVALRELVGYYPAGLTLTGDKLSSMIAQDLRRFEATPGAGGRSRPQGKRGLLWDLVRNGSPRSTGGLRKLFKRFLCPPRTLHGTDLAAEPAPHADQVQSSGAALDPGAR